MAVYTDITDEDLQRLLADFDIGAPLALKGVAEGVENSNFMLETEAGRYFLTVYEKRVRREDLPFFLGLLTWLADHGYPSAAPVADRQGQVLKHVRGKPATIVSFLPGLSVRRPSLSHCSEAGAGLARLHLTALDYPHARANDLGQAAWAPMFAGLGVAADALRPGLAAAIHDDLGQIATRWPTSLPIGIIHADYFPDNVFFRGGRFAGTIDFYFACVDILAYDLAIALNAWCFEADGGFNLAAARALITGYEAHRPLAQAERTALPVLAHGAAMRFFLTRLADWGATPPGALVRPKDPSEYERKLAFHRQAKDLPLFENQP